MEMGWEVADQESMNARLWSATFGWRHSASGCA